MDTDIDRRAAADLRLVDIDMDDLHIVIMAPGHDLALQTCAKADHKVDVSPQAVRDRHADRQRIIGWHDAMAGPEGDDRRTCSGGKLADKARIPLRAAADNNHRGTGRRDQFRRPVDRISVNGRRGAARRRQIGKGARHILCPEIDGDFQPDRLRPSRNQRSEGVDDMADSVAPAGHPVARFGQPLEDPELVGNFMQKAVSLSLRPGRNLPDKRKDRRVHTIGRRQGCRCIEKAGAGDNAERLRLASGQCRARGHVGGPLFMARLNRCYGVRMVEQRIEKMVVLNPGKAIELFDAVRDQRFHGEFGDCRCHRSSRVVHMRPDHSAGGPSS